MISLSIIVPVFNEEKTIKTVLRRLSEVSIPGIKKEIVIVDDGSTDRTVKNIEEYLNKTGKSTFKLFKHAKNQGKGRAVRTGISKAKGEYVVIQDADLEYEPKYLHHLTKPIVNKEAKIVYGTRLKRWPNLKDDERNPRFLLHYFGNRSLSLMISLFFFNWITDMETGYKVFPRKEFAKLDIKAMGFEFEPEITIKLLKRGFKIKEIPIRTRPRDYSEGKKLNTVRDGSKAFLTILKLRIAK